MSSYSFLQLYDGFDDTGAVLKVLCGFGENDDLDKIKSSSNVLFLVFHALNFPARFSLNWDKVATPKKTPKPITSRKNLKELVDLTLMRQSDIDFSWWLARWIPNFVPNAMRLYVEKIYVGVVQWRI